MSSQQTRIWLHGLVAAFVGGGASGVSAGLAVVMKDPDHFNLQAGLAGTLEVSATAFIVSGILMAAAYLKQSPLPDWDGTDRRGNGINS